MKLAFYSFHQAKIRIGFELVAQVYDNSYNHQDTNEGDLFKFTSHEENHDECFNGEHQSE